MLLPDPGQRRADATPGQAHAAQTQVFRRRRGGVVIHASNTHLARNANAVRTAEGLEEFGIALLQRNHTQRSWQRIEQVQDLVFARDPIRMVVLLVDDAIDMAAESFAPTVASGPLKGRIYV